MRIIAGRLRGRPIAAPTGRKLRPTADRIREAVFNILDHGRGHNRPTIENARVLDGFAGTGAMGLEALSRGAAQATFMDIDVAPCRYNVKNLGETSRSEVIRADCLHPPPATRHANLVFLDPPYHENCAMEALLALNQAGWIAPDTVCVIESDAREEIVQVLEFRLLDNRRYGMATIRFFCRED